MNYESVLWLISYEYGLRLRDGVWIKPQQEKKTSLSVIKIKTIYYLTSDIMKQLNIGDIIYTIDDKQMWIKTSEDKAVSISTEVRYDKGNKIAAGR